jgi:hypothetical protein
LEIELMAHIEQLRLEAAERIRTNHRRAGSAAKPLRVTITATGGQFDLVEVEYSDGVVRNFERLPPSDAIDGGAAGG